MAGMISNRKIIFRETSNAELSLISNEFVEYALSEPASSFPSTVQLPQNSQRTPEKPTKEQFAKLPISMYVTYEDAYPNEEPPPPPSPPPAPIQQHTSDLWKTGVYQHDEAATYGDISTRMTDMQVFEPSSFPPPTSQSPNVGFTIWSSAPTTYYASQEPRAVSFTGAYVLSCLVYWCLGGWLIGGIAYVLAVIGQDHLAEGDLEKAVQYRNASYAVSVFGIIFGIVFIGVLVWYLNFRHIS